MEEPPTPKNSTPQQGMRRPSDPEWQKCLAWGVGFGVSTAVLAFILMFSHWAGEQENIRPAEAVLLWPMLPFLLGVVKIQSLVLRMAVQVLGYTILVFLVRLIHRLFLRRGQSENGSHLPQIH